MPSDEETIRLRAFWSGKTAVVAGATGFLGGWLVRQLLSHGSTVIALVRDPAKHSQVVIESLLDETIVEQGCIADRAFVDGIFRRHRIDAFFHAAYGADVNRVLREPVECFQGSALSTLFILDAIRRVQPWCAAVISSSDKAYGSQKLPYREDSPLMPTHPYEVAKAAQDLAAQSFGRVYGLPVAVTRCGNFFGPYDFNLTRLIPGTCESLAMGDVPRLRSNGRFTRDFLYIEDAADAHLMLAEKLAVDRALYGEAFNFSYGKKVEVIELVRRIMSLGGDERQPIIDDTVRAEIPHMRLSSEKARRMLKWRPDVGFDEGLKRTVEWYLSFFRADRPAARWLTAAGAFLEFAVSTGV